MFTALQDPLVEEGLRQQLDLIVREITRTYGSQCTIVLAGGFGRGEGSIRFTESNSPVPLHDFDLYVIAERVTDSRTHELMERRILDQLATLTGLNFEEENFVVGVEAIPRGSLRRLPPDLSAYEMKAASVILHGPDLRHHIPLTSWDVTPASGAITLFHRATALLKNVQPEYLEQGEFPPDRRLEAVYECCKVYTEICTALSLIGGFYEPSYSSRARKLESHFHKFPELQKQIPDLPEKVRLHTQMKLESDFRRIIERPRESWTVARRCLDVSLRYFMHKFLGTRFQQRWPDLCFEAERTFNSMLFHDYLAYYLRRLGIRGQTFVNAANAVFQVYDSVSFRRRVHRLGRNVRGASWSVCSPLQHIYLSSALVLMSLKDNGTVDDSLLGLGRSYLGRVFYPVGDSSGVESWKMERDRCVEAQRLYFVVKQQKTVL